MDKHLKSVGKEMVYTYCRFIILTMRFGLILSIVLGLLSAITVPVSVAILITAIMLGWCLGWIVIFKTVIKLFKLDKIEYV